MHDNRRVVLRRRPRGRPVAEDFALVREAIAGPAEGELLVRNLYSSLDPAMRRWMDETSYAEPIALDSAIRCTGVGRVVGSRHRDFEVGDHLIAMCAVEDYSVVRPGGFTRKIDADHQMSLSRYLSLYGPIGMTAYFSLLECGRPKEGETVLVSGAAGAVGSLVGQIAKIKSCRAVGIAGGAEKCALLINEFGFDAAIDYRARDLESLIDAIRAACPKGVDIYFDNVGGVILDAALGCINQFARLVECGMISQYNSTTAQPGPSNIWQIIAKAATMQGFLGRHYVDRYPKAMTELRRWSDEGRIHVREHIETGLENFYPAFMRLFDGTNKGKLLLQVDAEMRL